MLPSYRSWGFLRYLVHSLFILCSKRRKREGEGEEPAWMSRNWAELDSDWVRIRTSWKRAETESGLAQTLLRSNQAQLQPSWQGLRHMVDQMECWHVLQCMAGQSRSGCTGLHSHKPVLRRTVQRVQGLYWPSILGWLRGKRKRKENGRLEQGDWRAADPSSQAICEQLQYWVL